MTTSDDTEPKGQLLLFPDLTPTYTTYKDTLMNLTEERLYISNEHLVQALGFYLTAMNMWPYPNRVLVDADFGLDLNDDGLVEIDLTLEDEVSH